jgi:rsbT co-antagonist protein RsbR
MDDPAREKELLAQIDGLRARIADQGQLLAAYEAMSTPVIQVWEGVLAVPLVGAIDAARANRIMESLLNGIVRSQAEMVLLDVTGVPVVDAGVANYLLKTIKATSFLGAQCIVVGVGWQTALSIVRLDVDLGDVVTRSTMQAGIEYALNELGLTVIPREPGEKQN